MEISSRFIGNQRELKYFTLQESHYSKVLGVSLKYQSSCLRHLEFIDMVFDIECPLDWLPNCNQLETLSFIDSENLIEKILNPLRLSPLRQLKSLTFKEDPVPANTLTALIKSSSINLREILFGWPEDCRQEGYFYILKDISVKCLNLTKLGATIGRHEILELFLILEKCSYLQYLEIYGDGYIFDANEDLPKLGELLPPNFVELDIRARWRFSSDMFADFLDKSSQVPLFKISIKYCDFINEDHFKVIKNSNSSLKYFTLDDNNFSVSRNGLDNASKWLRTNIFF